MGFDENNSQKYGTTVSQMHGLAAAIVSERG
jgi:hypothetical protein